MHGLFEKSGETVKRLYRDWGIGIFALPVLLVIAVAGLALTHLDASNAMSDAVQAQFTGAENRPGLAPRQIAQPAGKVSAIRAD
ncbi:MAG: hypothetical protein QOJ15_8079 [Bradyrhizobium sp.]|nr:hypothetical protein [Bradyrhizobium sp.]